MNDLADHLERGARIAFQLLEVKCDPRTEAEREWYDLSSATDGGWP